MTTYSKHRLDDNGNPTMYVAFKCCSYDGRVQSRGVDISKPLPKGYYMTEQEALDAHKVLEEAKQQEYLAFKPEAEKQLDQHEDYMYISVTIGRHTYTRNISY